MPAKRLLWKLKQDWNVYKYRFVPWIIFNLKKRKTRQVTTRQADEITTSEKCLEKLHNLLQRFSANEDAYAFNLDVLYNECGFKIEKKVSSIKDGGFGVFVTDGCINKGSIVALYPGCIYQFYEPILLQSIRNKFIFRCIDGSFIDGKDKGLSLAIYKSCSRRDRVGHYQSSDLTWFTNSPINPLSIGQYINNQSSENESNVVYQELWLPCTFPMHLRCFIPNARYSSALEMTSQPENWIKIVILVASKDIKKDQELFSNYFTIVS